MMMTSRHMLSVVALLPFLASATGTDQPKGTRSKGASPSDGRAGVTVMYPPDGCVLSPGTVQIVAIVGGDAAKATITLDGKPLEFRRMRVTTSGKQAKRTAKNPANSERWALVATAVVASGKHVFAVGPRKVRISASPPKDGKGAAGDAPRYRPHPGQVANCALCHEMKKSDAGPVLGEAKEPDTCFACHDRDEFKLTHAHRIESLAACRMCHTPHGGTAKALLVGKAEALCTKCHDL